MIEPDREGTTPRNSARMDAREDRIDTVDSLRGVAVLAVVWFHLTNGNPMLPSSWLRTSGRLGWLGVEVFFVISGFVIPHALYRANYRLRDCGRFLLRRAARLEPPYVVSIFLMMGLALISARLPGFRGHLPSYSVPQLLSHLPYVTGLLGFTWINIAYWSLALELQYYLLIGWVFPLIAHQKIGVRVLTILLLEALAFVIPNDLLVFHWLPLFVMGVLTFMHRHALLNVRWYVVSVIGATACTLVTFGPIIAVVGSATSLMIAFVDINASPLLFLGSISYSLYLVHVPIGGRLINATLRFSLGPVTIATVTVVTLGVSILAATVFYRLVEQPAKQLAFRIEIRKRSTGRYRSEVDTYSMH